MPKSAQEKAKDALHEIGQAETKEHGEKAFDLFVETYGPKYPKVALCLEEDREKLMAFYPFPAKHWQSIRTTHPMNQPLEPSATVPNAPKDAFRNGMLHMLFKLGECAQQKWRRVSGFADLTKVMNGVKFKDGVEVPNLNLIVA